MPPEDEKVDLGRQFFAESKGTTQDTKPNVDTMTPAPGFVIQPVDCLAR